MEKSYYFVGIKGTGMAALARVLHDRGYHVEGSDIEKETFTQAPLEQAGIQIHNFDPANIKPGMIIVQGNAFGDDQPEIVRAKELGDKVNIEMSGGVRDDASLDAALEAGAARVNIGTAALENPDWTASVIKKYGDRVAVGLDVRGHTLAARGWVKEGGDLFETMKFLDSVGCSRYVVTDVARDGMMSGPNIELLREVASRTDAKVTASGGISKLDDLRNIKELAELGVDAAILGKSLYARAFTLEEALEVAR